MTRITVSIINFRTAELTVQCVRSVLVALDQAPDVTGHVVVVDNASGDGSAEEIATWIAQTADTDRVSLVRSATNSGFSGGHNQGVGAQAAEWYLVLNSDALLKPDFFNAIFDPAALSAKTGLIAPQLQGEDGVIQPSCFRFPGPASELIRSAHTGVVTRLLKQHEVSLGPTPDPDAVEWASFACIMLRHEMVQEIGPMDEGYFLYFEDAEYCLRARRAGWRIQHVPQAVAVHFRGGSGPVKKLAAAKKRLPAYFYKSRSRFLYQAHGWAGLIGANLLWYLGRLIANGRRLIGRPIPPVTQSESKDIWIHALTPMGPQHTPGE